MHPERFICGSGKACKRRLVFHTALFVVAAMLLTAAAPSPAPAANRGIQVKLRASERADAAVDREVSLYNASYALVIGINAYSNGWPRLSAAVQDAQLVAKELADRGFTVTLKTDLDADDLEKAFKEFFVVKGDNPQARLFVWFAGHGHTMGGEGFLIPADAPAPSSGAAFKLKALSLRRFGELVRLARSKHAFAVFDSCFSGTIFTAQRSMPPAAVTRATTLPVRQFLSSGDANQQVSDDGRFRKLFVRALHGEERADANGDGYITGSELGLFLTDRLTNLTGARQTPRYGKLQDEDYDRGDFIFLAGGSALITRPMQTSNGGGMLKIDAEPAGVRVFVNNTDKGTAPLQLSGLAPGEYRVRAEKNGYAPQSRKVTVRSGSMASVRFYLDEVRQTGRLYVHPEPTDARVRIMNINPAYYDGIELEPGRYQIQVEKSGYETVTQWESVSAGQNQDIYITLKKDASAAAPSGGGQSFTNNLGMDFVYIQPGTFMMGSPSSESGRDSDERQHRVTLTRGFYMQTTEVTQGQWKAVMGSNPSRFSSCGDNCPVESVSWNDVQEFIQKLNRRTGQTYRLPTEAEWEYACRAGSTTAFANGGIQELKCGYEPNLDKMGWYCGNSSKKTHTVAQKQPNAWGLYDMHGNVWEWCQDWYDKNYSSGSVTDPTGPSSGTYRVMRGGSWSNDAHYCRSAIRNDSNPSSRNNNLGFRLVLLPGQ